MLEAPSSGSKAPEPQALARFTQFWKPEHKGGPLFGRAAARCIPGKQ